METRTIYISLLMSLAFVFALGQQKPLPAKPQPDARRLNLPFPPAEVKAPPEEGEMRRTQELPKIDLPEFVITGIASIDLPEVEKESAEENIDAFAPVVRDYLEEARDRVTAEVVIGDELRVTQPIVATYFGRAAAGFGSYNTPKLGIWFGRKDTEYHFLGEAKYHITRGFAPYTNRSDGKVGVSGGRLLHSSSPWLDLATVGGLMGYESETYKFYGSATPSFTRTASKLSIGGNLTAPFSSSLEYEAGLHLTNLSLRDSTSSTTQNTIDVELLGRFPIESEVIESGIRFSNASLSGASSANLPYLDVSIGTSKLWWGRFFVQPSAHFYYGKGMLGQELVRAYPHVNLGCRLSGRTVAMASYEGRVRPTTLGSAIETYPYLSTTTPLRHSDFRVDLSGGVETDWDDVWRSRFTARLQSVEDFPLYSDSARQGIGMFLYGGKTTIASYRGDVFAKFSPNSYFALALVVNSSENTVKGGTVPYLPGFEASVVYSYGFPFGLTVAPRVNFVDQRTIDVIGKARVAEYLLVGLHVEYAVFGTFNLFLDINNLTDRKYDEWRGFRAPPLLMHLGLNVRW